MITTDSGVLAVKADAQLAKVHAQALARSDVPALRESSGSRAT